jgi:hypothetical protein
MLFVISDVGFIHQLGWPFLINFGIAVQEACNIDFETSQNS